MRLKEYMGTYMIGERCETFSPSWWAKSTYDVPSYYISGNKVFNYQFFSPNGLIFDDETHSYFQILRLQVSDEEYETLKDQYIHKFFKELEATPNLFKQYKFQSESIATDYGSYTIEHIEFVPYHKPINFSDLDDEFKAQGIEFRQQDPNERGPYEWNDPIIKNSNHNIIIK